MDMNDESVKCPACGGGDVALMETYATAGTVMGGGVGFAVGYAAAREGAKAGMSLGVALGSVVPIVGPAAGAAAGGLAGGQAGMHTGAALGRAAGGCVDKRIVGEWRCLKCEARFKTQTIASFAGPEAKQGG